MTYKEFKEKIEVWGRKYNYVTEVTTNIVETALKVESNGWFHCNTHISNRYRFVLDTDWKHFKEIEERARGELFSIILKFAKTPIEERKKKRRNII